MKYSPTTELKTGTCEITRVGRKESFAQSIDTPSLKTLSVHQKIGNQAFYRLIQAKLKLGAPDDAYEREADRIADLVMRMPEPSLKRQPTNLQSKYHTRNQNIQAGRTIPPLVRSLPCIQRQLDSDVDEQVESTFEVVEKNITDSQKPLPPIVDSEDKIQSIIQRKSSFDRNPQLPTNTHVRINALRGKGKPIPYRDRKYFEDRMGQDFGGVRIHNDQNDASIANNLQAKAFTFGQDIVFNERQYAPEKKAGKWLLAHELVHVVQQNGIGNGAISKTTFSLSCNNPTIQCKAQVDSCKNTGYSETVCGEVKKDFNRAERYLIKTIGKLRKSTPTKLVMGALEKYFNLKNTSQNQPIVTKLEQILSILRIYRDAAYFRRSTPEGCKKAKEPVAYVEKRPVSEGSRKSGLPKTLELAQKEGFLDRPIFLCGKLYFGVSDTVKARALIHEAGHLMDLSPTPQEDYYYDPEAFLILKSSTLLKNADSYAHLAVAIGKGSLPFQLPFYVAMGVGTGGIVSAHKSAQAGVYGKIYFDLISRKALWKIVYPFGRISFTLLGTPTTPQTAGSDVDLTILAALLGGARIRLRKRTLGTNLYIMLGAGPVLTYTEVRNQAGERVKTYVGFKGMVAGGLRWKSIDVTAGASYLYLPKVPGFEHSVQVGARAALLFNWP